VLRLAQDGACACFERGSGGRPHLCAIHRRRGPDALPSACRHFPRVIVIDRRGTHVTLSHFCPTAAAMLFREMPLTIVASPPACPDVERWEGLDATDALPPLLRSGMLMDLESYGAWEAHAIAVLGDEGETPEGAVARLADDAGALISWMPADGLLADRVRAVATEGPRTRRPAAATKAGFGAVADTHALRRAYDLAVRCVPEGLPTRPVPVELAALDPALVAPAWPLFARPLRHYLAAKAFASWVAWQGGGLLAVVRSLSLALAVVRVEAARACQAAGRPLDELLMVEALRQADRLIVHEASREALADQLEHAI
jgi:hypothetical protein